MVSKCIIHLVLLVLLGFATLSQAANITVAADRSQIQVNESFNLEFRSDAEVDDDPNFAPLEKDFDIISRSQSSNIQILNGRMSREITWNLTLIPKRTGNLQIPAIAFGSDSTQPLAITVSQAKKDASNLGDTLVYMEAIVDKPEIYVQSQLKYTLRIYHAAQLRNASLSELEISDKDAIVEKVDENRQYEKYINGRRYRVFEKQYVIFPQTVGELDIEPATLDAQYIELPRSFRTKRISSDRIKVKVLPIPAEIVNKKLSYWLPATSLSLSEQWSDQQKEIKVGEPVTRTLTMRAEGLLASQLPELSDNTSQDQLKQYADQPVLDNKLTPDGYVGTRQEKVAYIAAEPGQVQLPGVDIVWWNINTEKMETASLPPRTITVVGAAASAPSTTDSAPIVADEGKTTASENQTHNATGETVTVGGVTTPVWFWVSVVFMLLWLVTLLLWLKAKRNAVAVPAIKPEEDRNAINAKAAIKKVKAACDGNNPQQAKDALIDWARMQWPESPPTSLGHIARRINGQLATELVNLNNVLYKPNSVSWNSSALWHAVSEFVTQQQKQQPEKALAIEPLFRLANLGEEHR